MSKKKIILSILIAIGIIISTFFTAYITKTNAIGPFTLGNTYYLGQDDKDKTVTNSGYNLMNMTNKNFFCGHSGVWFAKNSQYGTGLKYKNVATVTITGDVATCTAIQNYNTTDTRTYTSASSVYNKALALLFYRVKGDTVQVSKDGTYEGKADGNTYKGAYALGEYDRTRSCKIDEGFHYDIAQPAIWKGLVAWRSNVATTMDNGENATSIWKGLSNYIQSTTDIGTYVAQFTPGAGEYEACVRNQIKTLAMGYSVWDDVWAESNNIVSEDYQGYGIQQTAYKDSSSEKEVKTREKSGDYTILGPFKYNFIGSLESNPTLTFNSSSTAKKYDIGTYEGGKFTVTNIITSGSPFYIRVATSLLSGVEKINFKFQVAGINWAKTTTTLQFFGRTIYDYDKQGNITGLSRSYQPMIYFDQTEAEYESYTDSYKISKPVNLTVKKVDEAGIDLKVAGIKFEIKDSAGVSIGTLETDSNGVTGEIELEAGKEYSIIETFNNDTSKYGYYEYGHKGGLIWDISLESGDATWTEREDPNWITRKITLEEDSTLKIWNYRELWTVYLHKKDSIEDRGIPNVEFIIEQQCTTNPSSGKREDIKACSTHGESYNKYLRLIDKNGNFVEKVTGNGTAGMVTINRKNDATDTEYEVEYVTSRDNATKFVTNATGHLAIRHLEVYRQSTSHVYRYNAIEVSNENHGYISNENTTTKWLQYDFNGGSKTTAITNQQYLGNLELKKYDQENNKILLSNVGFAIQASTEGNSTYRYLQVYDAAGNLKKNITGEVTINKGNVATETEYRLSYFESTKEYAELTSEEKKQITNFKTGSDGKIKINNLEVYRNDLNKQYTYKIIETSNGNYGYEVDSVELGNIKLEQNKTTSKELGNTQKYIKISGYVWEELQNKNKSNTYDSVYTEGIDNRLKSLYERYVPDGQTTRSTKPYGGAEIPITIGLHNTTTDVTVPPTDYDTNGTGKYTFEQVEIAELENYEIVFYYNGLKYTTVALTDLWAENSSKVKENDNDRKTLNSKFETVEKSEDGKDRIVGAGESYEICYMTNTVEEVIDGETFAYPVSTIDYLRGMNTSVKATTTDAGTELDVIYTTKKNAATEPLAEIENINMGIVLREQPELALSSDIYTVSVEVNGKNYNYNYNGIGLLEENDKENPNPAGVKFESKYKKSRYDKNPVYTRIVYESDVEALVNNKATMNVSITYRIKLENQTVKSGTLTSVVKEITNYYDKNYTMEKVYYFGDAKEEVEIKQEGYWYDEKAEKVKQGDNLITNAYKSTRIKLGDLGIRLEEGQDKDIYIKFSVSQDAIKGLLTEKSTYHNATEIMSYKTLYGQNTGKQYLAGEKKWEAYTSELNEKDTVYAGIDAFSAPGNIKLELIEDTRNPEGTLILNTETYEDDTSSSPSLLLEAKETRMISGKVWEDNTQLIDDERKGNGKLDNGESAIENVTVTLHHANADGTIGDIAKYSNGDSVTTTTDANGNYTLGYKAEDGTYVGILPGNYIMVYTYNNNSVITGKRNINVNDYKSTLITSQLVKDAFEKPEENDGRWFTREDARYSNARDDIGLRPEFDDSGITTKNSNYNTHVTNMNAYTPVMDIGIEFTETNEANETFEDTTGSTITNTDGTFIYEFKNIDFGISERPRIIITMEKEITGLEIMAQNGTAIVPKGDPTDLNSTMQYVKKLPGIVSAEIEENLLQGAQLNLEYTIKHIDESEKDYLSENYYYYGENKENPINRKVLKVIDYMDDTMKFDTTNNQEGVWVTKTAEQLKSEGLVDESVYKTLKEGNYAIFMTENFKTEDNVKLYATKALAVSTEINEKNRVEIIELTGSRTITDCVPGNYKPSDGPTESDSDIVSLVITGPTGSAVNYILYAISGIAMLGILVAGIVIIKKKIMK